MKNISLKGNNMKNCPKCESEKLSKYGKSPKGKQRFQCQHCFSILTENQSHFPLTDSEKILINKIAKEGNSLRSIARIIGKSYTSIYFYLKKNSLKTNENMK